MTAGESNRTDAEAWHAGLDPRLQRQLTIDIDSDDPLIIRVTESTAGRSVTLPLAQLPDGCVIRFKRSFQLNDLRLEGCRPGLTVELSGGESYNKLELDGELGTLRLHCPVNQPILGRATRVALCGGAHKAANVASAASELVLDGGSVEGNLERTLTIGARGGNLGQGRIKELHFVEPNPAGDDAVAAAQTFKLTLGRGVSLERVVVPDGSICELTDQAATVSVLGGHVKTDQSLTVEEIEGSATVSGKGTVVLPAEAVIGDLTLDGPGLEAGIGTTILGMAGALKVVKAADATIVARRGSAYRFRGVIGNDREKLKGATLRGLTIEDTAHGRRYLRQLNEAAVVDPSLRDMRIRDYGFRWRCFRARDRGFQRPWARNPVTENNRRSVQDAAYFAQELAGLVDARSGEGSTRTATAWAAYRGRQLVATTRIERWALAMYRLVGYGQRAGPALATWVVAVLIGAFVFKALHESTDGYGEALWRLAFAPFTLLRLVGDPGLREVHKLTDALATAVQTVVTIPIVFAGIATARYLRADWPFKP